MQTFQTELKILGYKIGKGYVQIDPEKIKHIKEFGLPKTIKSLQLFLGLVNYCRNFIPKLAETTESLYNLLTGKKKSSESTST
ncbi:hypothetical protein ENBRE01_0070 [Enteropsectra breve]|nr:hypothetical protein ENBRE01_0070 [Enteropsectra breve]